MADPRTQLLSFPLDLGMDVNSDPETVQPFGERPRVVASYNTRLTKVRGRVCKAPGVSTLASSLDRCGGIVPCGSVDSAVAFFHPGDGGNRRISGGTVDTLNALFSTTDTQNAYWPVQVSRAGALPASASTRMNPAVAHDSSSGYTYYATFGTSASGFSAIFLTVLGSDGELVCVPTRVVDYLAAIATPFVALTAHPGRVLLWYKSTASNAILCAQVTVTGLQVSIGTPSTIFTPSSIPVGSAAIAYDQTDTSNVYLICFTAAGNDARLLRVNPVSRTVSQGLDVVTGASATAKHAIAYVNDGTTGTLVWMVSWSAGNCSLFAANATSLATVWSQTNRMWWADNGSISCGFWKVPGVTQAVFGTSRQGTVASTATPAGTQFEFRAPTSGALSAAVDMPWHQMVSQICTHKVETSTNWYPVVAVETFYATAARSDPTSVNFVPDPSIMLLRPRSNSTSVYWDIVARVGSDIAVRYPSFSSEGAIGGCNNLVQSDTKTRLSYLSENLAEGLTSSGYIPRYVDLDWTPSSPRYGLLATGQAIIAAALPAVWDGAELTEIQPVATPKIWGSSLGGTGTPLTGTYLFAAVVSWKDAAGFIHRSPPSNIVSLSPAATSVQLWVTKPIGYRNGTTQDKMTVTIYASQNGGITLYAQNYLEITASSTAYWLAFTLVNTPLQNALTPPLYSEGGATDMLVPYHPNAAIDSKVIGDRAWLLDPETNRAYYSQPLSTEALTSIFPAFNSMQYVGFPASAGKLVALENWHEQPRFHTTNGVWTVDGEGPDALNQPPYFSAPRQLSDFPCTDAQSVVLTPAGIMFRSSKRFAISGDQFGLLDDMLATTDIVGAAVFRDQHEVVFFSSFGGCFVYNFLKQAWTIWQETVTDAGASITCAVQDPWSGSVLYYSPNQRRLMSMDPTTVSSTSQVSIDLGRVIPGNPQEDITLQRAILRAAKGGTHGLRIAMATDYEATQVTKIYSSSDVDSAVVNGRYDLWPEPKVFAARAVYLGFTETGATGEGFQPINVTLELIRNQGKRAASLRTTGGK